MAGMFVLSIYSLAEACSFFLRFGLRCCLSLLSMKKKSVGELKILQLPSWYLPESGRFCRDQAMLLKRNGVDIDVLANVPLPWRKYKWKVFSFPFKPFFSEEDGLTVLRNYSIRIPRSEKLNMKRWLSKTLQLFDLYVKEKGMPDVIHAHTSFWGGYAAYLIREKYRIPYVLTEHTSFLGYQSDYSRSRLKYWYKPCLEKIYTDADYILPVGSWQVDTIKEYKKNDKDNIRVVTNIVYSDLFFYKERERPDKEFVFVALNSFDYYKAYDILLPAYDLVYDKYPHVRLRIAGEGFDSKEFKKLASKCRHADKIEYLGFLSSGQVRDELWNAHALVLPSRSESQSITVLEAITTGLPVVCTEVVPPEVVSEKQGYRVPVEDVGSLAEAMLKMVETIAGFDSEAIAEHALSVAGDQVFISKTKAIYQQVLDTYLQ